MKLQIPLVIATLLLALGLPMLVEGLVTRGPYLVSGALLTALGLFVESLWLFRRKAQST